MWEIKQGDALSVRRSAVCIGGVGKICKTTINFALNAME